MIFYYKSMVSSYYNHCHFHQLSPYRGSSGMSQIWVQRWHFLMPLGYCWFWWYFITKVWSVHITIIVIFISWVPYRGSSEMSQIWVQRWHFLMLLGYCWFWWYFITKVWSVHITIIVIFILIFNIDVWKCPFGCRGHTFKASGFLLILMIFHWCWY